MATFKKRDSGWWQAVIRRKGHPQESKTFELYDDAVKWARDIENQIDKGTYFSRSEAERMTVSDLIDRFKKEFAPQHYRKREDEKEAWKYQCAHLDAALGEYSLASLDQKLAAKYREDRLKCVSESTVRKELFMLSKILGFAETECGITLPRGNPVEKIRKPSEGKSRERRLSKAEWKKFEAECKASRNIFLWPAVELAIETAMRQGELLGLRWEKVDKKRKLAFIAETKNGEARTVPLSPRALSILEGLPHAIKGEVIPLQRMTLYHVFHAAVLRAEIQDFTFHDLRHEAMSRLAERGDFSMLELAAMSGHKTLQMLKRYTHLQSENISKKLARKHT